MQERDLLLIGKEKDNELYIIVAQKDSDAIRQIYEITGLKKSFPKNLIVYENCMKNKSSEDSFRTDFISKTSEPR